MKQFFKIAFASAFGLFIASLIMGFFLIFGIIGVIALSSNSNTESVIKEQSVLHLKLSGELYERKTQSIMNILFPEENEVISLDEILEAIAKAKDNPNIKGIYIEADYLATSKASAQSIREALIDFKSSGKFIISYANTYSQNCYYISTAADSVIINPQGNLDLSGLSMQSLFFKKALDKLGIEVDIFRVGTYKAAVEPFMLDKMSPANKEQLGSFISSIWSIMGTDIANSRKMELSKLDSLINQGVLLRSADYLKQAHLVDAILYKSQVDTLLQQKTGKTEYESVSITQMAMSKLKKSEAKDEIAILYAHGEIKQMTTPNDIEAITSKALNKEIKKLQKNDNIKAVVLRINSPGGSAFESEQIWKALVELKSTKPLIVSMGDYAASGGYYIAVPADVIVAEPTTLTGSIGVFGMIPNLGNIREKMGISIDGVSTHTYSDISTIGMRPMKAGEKQLMQNSINEFYELFIKRCADGRSMTPAQIKAIAEGRIWTGKQALENHLVDELGGINRAISIAADKANLKSYTIGKYPAEKSLVEMMSEDILSGTQATIMRRVMGSEYQYYELLNNIKSMAPIQARLPLSITVE